jgi:hypothetical protein
MCMPLGSIVNFEAAQLEQYFCKRVSGKDALMTGCRGGRATAVNGREAPVFSYW